MIIAFQIPFQKQCERIIVTLFPVAMKNCSEALGMTGEQRELDPGANTNTAGLVNPLSVMTVQKCVGCCFPSLLPHLSILVITSCCQGWSLFDNIRPFAGQIARPAYDIYLLNSHAVLGADEGERHRN